MVCKHPFIYPDGNCTDCGVLATTMPGHVENYHQMVQRPSRILDFYADMRTDDKGRTLADIQGWDDEKLEGCHDQIQWMFPVPERSRFNISAPVLTKDVIEQFRLDPQMKANLRTSFLRMMKFYGFAVQHQNFPVADNPVKVIAPFDFDALWLSPSDHNHLRLTRIIRSLRLLGLENESMALFLCLAKIWGREQKKDKPRITDDTLGWWLRAAAGTFEKF